MAGQTFGVPVPQLRGDEVVDLISGGRNNATTQEIANLYAGSSGNVSSSLVTTTGTPAARTLASRFSAPLNALDFGAIGNGASNPASSTYGTLQALQAVYGTTVGGVAIALTNELDWLGHQKAIDTAHAAVGGVLYSPAGTYVYSNSNSVSDGSGTILFPETGATNNATSQKNVDWAGDGYATIHKWPSDLGAGRFAVTCTNRLNTVNGSFGVWRDMVFVGPNNSVAFGSSPASMHGLGWSEYREVRKLRIIGFKGGICLNSGGQTKLEYLETWNNYFGIYFDAPNATGDNGDLVFIRCAMNNSTMAGIGIANSLEIAGSLFLKCGFFTSPYGIFKETGGTQAFAMAETTFLHTQFEQLGNALFSDGLAAGAHIAQLGPNIKFEQCEYLYNGSFTYATNPKLGIICAAFNFGTLEFIRPNTISTLGDAVATQTHGLFEIDNPGWEILLSGDLFTLFPYFVAASCPIGTGFFSNHCLVFENTGPLPWKGIGVQAFGTGTNVAIGNVIAYTGTGGSVAGSAGNTTEQIVGICMLTNNGVSSGPVVVAQTGIVSVANAGSNAISNGALCRASSAGQVISSSGQFEITSKNIGMWLFGSGSSPNLVGQLVLQGII